MTRTTWWFAINDENSDMCGEEFLVEVNVPIDRAKACAVKIAKKNFPHEKLKCYGRVGLAEAEMMGLDTY